jgi:hypothetical protein
VLATNSRSFGQWKRCSRNAVIARLLPHESIGTSRLSHPCCSWSIFKEKESDLAGTLRANGPILAAEETSCLTA